MTEQHNNDRALWDRRSFLQTMGAALVATAAGCDDDEEATNEGGGEGKAVEPGSGKGADPVKAESRLKKFQESQKARFSMTDMVHFADRSHSGLLAIPLGTVASRKYLNGGWRSGWRTDARTAGDVEYFEADSKSARVFFKHTKGGFDRIIVRMKAVKKSNTVTFYVNDEAISTTDISSGWKNYTVNVPTKATRGGENQFMMRFKYSTKAGGRTQVAHVASVHVLPKGSDAATAPSGDAVQKISFGSQSYAALVAVTPQTYTYRLDIPSAAPKLAMAIAAKVAGATFKVAIKSDITPAKTLLDETVVKDKAGQWQDQILDLTPFAGQVAEIEMTVGGTWAAGQVAAWGEPGLYSAGFKDSATAPVDPTGGAKNIVVYLIDTLRWDKFDFYNARTHCKTPNISAFSRDATIFDHAYDNENWTKPSTATILTGLLPDTHKAKEDTSRLPGGALMISEHLKAKGFKTGSFIANGYVSDKFGFKKGWDYYTNYIREGKNTNADRVVKDSLDWIEKNKGGRFFAYVHTIDPHVPYSPPQKWREMYWKRAYDGPIKPQATGQQLADIKTKKLDLSREDKKYLEALYNGETSFNDSAFGTLIAGLKEKGLYEDTAIVILADHGEEFWDHGSVGHGHSLYEELVHSPLIVRAPRAAKGRRVPHVVSMVDLAPSMCDLVGVEPSKSFEGTSWTDCLDGVGQARPRIAVSDFLYRKKSVRIGRYKWHTIGRGGKLFDIIADPRETKDLIKKHGIGRAYVRSNFGLYKGAKNKSAWWEASDSDGPLHEFDADTGADLDAETLDMLKAMGYVDGAKAEGNAADDKKKMEEEDK